MFFPFNDERDIRETRSNRLRKRVGGWSAANGEKTPTEGGLQFKSEQFQWSSNNIRSFFILNRGILKKGVKGEDWRDSEKLPVFQR